MIFQFNIGSNFNLSPYILLPVAWIVSAIGHMSRTYAFPANSDPCVLYNKARLSIFG